MESLRESFLHLTFQMSSYKRATSDEEELIDTTPDRVYQSPTVQVRALCTYVISSDLSAPCTFDFHLRRKSLFFFFFFPLLDL